MKYKYVIQARLGSTRLPEKVLSKIGKKNILEHVYSRLLDANISKNDIVFVIADESNKKLAAYLVAHQMPFELGDKEDVLQRYINATEMMNADDYVFRLTGDNPFVEISQLQKLKHKIAIDKPDIGYIDKMPLGLGIGAIKISALRSQLNCNLNERHFEHVSLYIKENMHKYNIQSYEPDILLPVKSIRLTIDEEADLQLARQLEKSLPDNFGLTELKKLCESDPTIFDINSSVKQINPLERSDVSKQS